MRFYFFIRWFALDSVLCVAVVQTFLMLLFSKFSLFILFGLCCVTSLFYILDRVFDLYLDSNELCERHFIYQNRYVPLGISLIVLGCPSIIFWLLLPTLLKFYLFLIFCIYVAHLVALKIKYYHFLKPFIVAFIFTLIMVVFYEQIIVSQLVFFIYSYTCLNLVGHEFIELKRMWYFYGCILLSIITIFFAIQISHLFMTFVLISVTMYLVVIYFNERFKFWFECGELLYSVPFILMGLVLWMDYL
ncbi:MAG: hypothetical protein VW397_00665 [Candidatus Margulisiibacteriota bacterium]